VAKQELLDAAERVFIEFQPDQVGLKDIAREAGTSHALITHYFGTYAGLVEATLERRLQALREQTREQLKDIRVLAHPENLIGILFRALEDPVHLRLVRWLLASERPSAAHAFGLAANGIQLVAAQVAAALAPTVTREVLDKVELAMMTAVAAAYGYAIGKYALVGSAGRQPSRALDEQVQATLAQMVQAHIRTQLGEALAKPA
jgi:TetR/AcrR family transcriptional regulator, repressor for neighboring sulfatase